MRGRAPRRFARTVACRARARETGNIAHIAAQDAAGRTADPDAGHARHAVGSFAGV